MLYFATSNAGKLREARAILGVPIEQIDLDLPEIQTLDVATVVREKALVAHRLTGKPVLVDDTGFAITDWQGLPGALVRWFVTTVGPAGICRMADSAASRAVVVSTAVAFCTGPGAADLHLSTGSLPGVVTDTPRGTNGFGWDAIFQPDGHAKTFAEMTDEEKNAISPRRIALEKLSEKYEVRSTNYE